MKKGFALSFFLYIEMACI